MDEERSIFKRILTLWLAVSAAIFFVGCLDLSDFFSNSDGGDAQPPTGENNIDYGLPPGYQVLGFHALQAFGGSVPESLHVQQLVLDNQGGTICFDDPMSEPPTPLDWWHSVMIDSDDVNQDILIGIDMPDMQHCLLELSPHPYQFQGNIELEMSYSFCNLLELGCTAQELEVFCWNDTLGIYQVVPAQLREAEQKIVASTDHFSRYVIAVGTGY